MQPQQPYYGSPTTPPPGQYDFIVNAGNKRSNDWFFRASNQTKAIIVAATALILLLILWIGLALFNSGPNDSSKLITVAQQQVELARVAQLATPAVQQAATKNFATTLRFTMTSDEQTLLGYLQSRGIATPDAKALSQGKNATVDKLLLDAKANGTYEQTYREIAKQQLTNYAVSLKQTYASVVGQRERALLSAEYDHAQLLIALLAQGQ